MERTKKNNDDIRWIKTGGGIFYLHRQGKTYIIKPGERFTATLEEIPEAFRDTVKPLDGTPIQTLVDRVEDNIDVTKAEYTLNHRGGGYYDVLDAQGKVISEGALRKEKAEELIASLS